MTTGNLYVVNRTSRAMYQLMLYSEGGFSKSQFKTLSSRILPDMEITAGFQWIFSLFFNGYSVELIGTKFEDINI